MGRAPLVRPLLLRLDWILLLAALGVVAAGLPYLHSADAERFYKQILWVLVGFTVMGGMMVIDYRVLLRHAYKIYAVALLLLVVVLMLPPVRHAHSWIRIPGVPFSIQPTEIMKLALILMLARHLRHRETQTTLKGLIVPFLLTLIPAALILKQPDLGSAMLLPPALFAIVFASGARVRHLAAIAAGGLISIVPLWMGFMKTYQKRRVLAFLNPEYYEAREAYQLIMSRISIGSGGLFGQGLHNGRLNELDLLPDKHTDFIFGVIAEEGGFVVAALLLALYVVVVLESLLIAYQTKEPGGRLLAVGCASMLGIQALINVGVVTALLPTTGLTLPLVSYGGSSLVVSLAMVGLVLNVGTRRPLVVGRESFTGELSGE